jgi:hypothetical protein
MEFLLSGEETLDIGCWIIRVEGYVCTKIFMLAKPKKLILHSHHLQFLDG